jgi:hypothetical protein
VPGTNNRANGRTAKPAHDRAGCSGDGRAGQRASTPAYDGTGSRAHCWRRSAACKRQGRKRYDNYFAHLVSPGSSF